jgi:hypothetical protein
VSYSRRLAALERVFSEVPRPAEGSEAGGPDVRRAFISNTLRALVHLRREPVDEPPYKYATHVLYDLNPFELAAYLCALRIASHPDADEADHLLRGAADEGALRRLVGAVVDRVRRNAA